MSKETIVSVRLKGIREDKGLTISELACKSGMLKQTIYKYERGITKNIPYDQIKRLADTLNVNPSYLVGWSNSVERTPDIINTKMSENDIISKIF